MKVVLRDQAYADLDNIFTWIAKDRPRSAHEVIDRILETAERLGSFPHLGHTGQVSGTFEWVVPGLPYIVLYRVVEEDDVVDVVAVVHGAQERKP
jgi:toxin ParE1/3/4